MDCDKLPTCIFFNDQMDHMPAVADVLKRQFCRGDFSRCARFKVAARLGGSNVPADLYPSDDERSDRVLAGVN